MITRYCIEEAARESFRETATPPGKGKQHTCDIKSSSSLLEPDWKLLAKTVTKGPSYYQLLTTNCYFFKFVSHTPPTQDKVRLIMRFFFIKLFVLESNQQKNCKKTSINKGHKN